ncbi:MAG TPA: carboxypeptidase-like regulatory domain-containing protein [Longimicrobium sp.]|nr:carboxypeptidase-like regulatory domain-containing protein [Longimicrobium sp.]
MLFMSACALATPGFPGTGGIGGVVSSLDGTPIGGASVHTPTGASTTTRADGSFSINGLQPTDRLAVTIITQDYVRGSVVYPVRAGQTLTRPVKLIPRARPVVIDTRTGGEISLPREGRVSIPANAFQAEDGRVVQGPVSVRMTYIDPLDAAQVAAAPGDYTALGTDGGLQQLETFGMIEMAVVDSQGRSLRLVRGTGVNIGWPSSREVRVSDTRGIYNFDEGVARWIASGPNRTFGGTLPYTPPRIGLGGVELWNDDDPLPRVCISVTVNRSAGTIIENVTATGVSYSGTSSAWTDGSKTARINVKPNSVVDLSVGSPYAHQQITSPGPGSGCPHWATLSH